SMDALNQGNVDEMLKELDAQATEYFDGSTPPVKGRDSIIAGIKGYVSAFPDIKGTNFKILAEGDHVMAYGEWTATFKNDFMGVKATGKTVRYSDVDMFRFNNEGKVVEHRSLFPVSQIMRMAGVQ
ncbi:MAG: ester cyclase, partial [Dinghuibacter sp.]|nr:ester cyclase [Dinghuibacter sp.]